MFRFEHRPRLKSPVKPFKWLRKLYRRLRYKHLKDGQYTKPDSKSGNDIETWRGDDHINQTEYPDYRVQALKLRPQSTLSQYSTEVNQITHPILFHSLPAAEENERNHRSQVTARYNLRNPDAVNFSTNNEKTNNGSNYTSQRHDRSLSTISNDQSCDSLQSNRHLYHNNNLFSMTHHESQQRTKSNEMKSSQGINKHESFSNQHWIQQEQPRDSQNTDNVILVYNKNKQTVTMLNSLEIHNDEIDVLKSRLRHSLSFQDNSLTDGTKDESEIRTKYPHTSSSEALRLEPEISEAPSHQQNIIPRHIYFEDELESKFHGDTHTEHEFKTDYENERNHFHDEGIKRDRKKHNRKRKKQKRKLEKKFVERFMRPKDYKPLKEDKEDEEVKSIEAEFRRRREAILTDTCVGRFGDKTVKRRHQFKKSKVIQKMKGRGHSAKAYVGEVVDGLTSLSLQTPVASTHTYNQLNNKHIPQLETCAMDELTTSTVNQGELITSTVSQGELVTSTLNQGELTTSILSQDDDKWHPIDLRPQNNGY